MKKIELVHGGLILPITDYLSHQGANVELLLEQVGISPAVVDLEQNPQPLPLPLLTRFLERAAAHVGDYKLTFRALNSNERLPKGELAFIRIRRQETPFEAIRAMVKSTDASTVSKVRLKRSAGKLWIDHEWPRENYHASQQTEQYAVTVFIDAVRCVLGADWRPANIHLTAAQWLPALPLEWGDSNPNFNCRMTAIAIKISDLAKPVYLSTGFPNETGSEETSPFNFGDAPPEVIQESVNQLIWQLGTSMRVIADAFGMNERTLRRRLRESGLIYQDILDEHRFRQAVRLLRDDDVSVTDLAFQLGYDYPHNFSRAFRNRIGMSPSKYRTLALSE